MRITGFQKLTLLDYPGLVACILFTPGCNFRCPFCHNSSLVLQAGAMPDISNDEIFDFLKKRSGILDGVVISGGEPLLQHDIEDFLKEVKALEYKVKLDTNGSFPKRLLSILDKGLVDYVAMDIKHTKEKYHLATGVDIDGITAKIEQSIDILRRCDIPYEFRTTFVKGIHTPDDIDGILEWINKGEKYYIQSYADSGDILSDYNFDSFSKDIFNNMLKTALSRGFDANLRGI